MKKHVKKKKILWFTKTKIKWKKAWKSKTYDE